MKSPKYEVVRGGSASGGKLSEQVRLMHAAIGARTELAIELLILLGASLSSPSLFSIQATMRNGVAIGDTQVWESNVKYGSTLITVEYAWLLPKSEIVRLIDETSHATVPS